MAAVWMPPGMAVAPARIALGRIMFTAAGIKRLMMRDRSARCQPCPRQTRQTQRFSVNGSGWPGETVRGRRHGQVVARAVRQNEPAGADERIPGRAWLRGEERLRQVLLAVTEIVLQMVAVVLEGVEPFVLDLPRSPGGRAAAVVGGATGTAVAGGTAEGGQQAHCR